MDGPHVVASDTGLGEGPVWCPDGTLVFTSVDRGLLYRVRPGDDRLEVVADTGGSPNSAQLSTDGGFVVTQAGGHDLSFADPARPDRDPALPAFYRSPARPRPVTPGLQRVKPDGSVEYLTAIGFQAPNDLVVSADGAVYFTDPPAMTEADFAQRALGRVWCYRRGDISLIADGFAYCNGIALDLDGTLIVVEREGLMRLSLDGQKEWIVPVVSDRAGDGMCLDVEGRIYVAVNPDRAVVVVEDGRLVDRLQVPGGDPGVVTNCCFGGPDGRTLFLNDAFHGRVLAWESMPTAGLEMHAWPAPS